MKRTVAFLAALLLAIALLDILYFLLLPREMLYPEMKPRAQQLPRTAAILFHDFADDYKGISLETYRRINLGLSLYEQALLDKIILTGGHRSDGKGVGSQLMKEYALAKGIPENIIVVAGQSQDSLGNLETVKNLLRGPGQPLLIVSSPYHLWRLDIIAADRLESAVLFPYDPLNCNPPALRRDIWLSAHYNFAALALNVLLPDQAYRATVDFIRTYTAL